MIVLEKVCKMVGTPEEKQIYSSLQKGRFRNLNKIDIASLQHYSMDH